MMTQIFSKFNNDVSESESVRKQFLKFKVTTTGKFCSSPQAISRYLGISRTTKKKENYWNYQSCIYVTSDISQAITLPVNM